MRFIFFWWALMGGKHRTLAHEDGGDASQRRRSVSPAPSHSDTTHIPPNQPPHPRSPVANDGQLKAHSRGANQICRPVIGLQRAGGRAFISPSLGLVCALVSRWMMDKRAACQRQLQPDEGCVCLCVCLRVCVSVCDDGLKGWSLS